MSDQAMTRAERSKLYALEEKIEAGERTYIEVGAALADIRDRRLYRAEHKNFPAYLKARWPKISKSHAYRLMAAVKVAENIPDPGRKPENLEQALALSQLPPEAQRAVSSAAAESDNPRTGKTLKKAADDIKNLPPEQQKEKIEGEQNEIKKRARRVIDNEGRRDRIKAIESHVRKLAKLTEGFGGHEAEEGLAALKLFRTWIGSLPPNLELPEAA